MRNQPVNLYNSPCFKGKYSILSKKIPSDKMDEVKKLVCSGYVKNKEECAEALIRENSTIEIEVPEEYDCGFLRQLSDTGIDFAYSVHRKTQEWFKKYLQSQNSDITA